jgi:hypothetical protein
MRKTMQSRLCLSILGAICALAPIVRAEKVLTHAVRLDAYQVNGTEVPAKESQRVLWIGKDRMRLETDESTIIVRLDQQKMYMMDVRHKVAVVIELPFEMRKYFPPELGEKVEKNAPFATVTPQEETKKIGDWNTRRYTVSIKTGQAPTSKEEVWTTKDLPVDLAEYAALNHQISMLRAGGGTMAEEMKRLEGIPVLTNRVRLMEGVEMRSREELVSVEEKPAPEGLFDVPADFVQKPFDPYAELQSRRKAAKKD